MRFLKKLFSIRNSEAKTHKIVTLFGLKLKFKFQYVDKKIKKFFRKIRQKSVLVIESNCCHYEVVPGYVKYFQELGYQTDICVPERSIGNWLQKMFPSAQVYVFGVVDLKLILADAKIRKYNYVIFTSAVKYLAGISGNSPDLPLVTDYFPKIAIEADKLIFVQHHLERMCANNNQIALADLHNQYSEKFFVVNPHYFGKVAVTAKNEETVKFIVVGGISAGRKNYHLLTEAVRQLKDKCSNFKVILVGGGTPPEFEDEIAPYFDVRGRLSYEQMSAAMEEADFFLCLLDPETPDHKRYVTIGTSGSFQLIYGFAKPCLLHKFFADVYGFDNHNALIYDHNDDLSVLMEYAVRMSGTNYRILQDGVKAKADEIYKTSRDNLRQLLQQNKK